MPGLTSVLLLFFGFFLFPASPQAQTHYIPLNNPSFEDPEPRTAKPPQGWFSCGNGGESPPDVHPSGAFDVRTRPRHGSTYVGLVVRKNGTTESLGQKLSRPLEAGKTYRFSLYAARSPRYLSFNPRTYVPIDYDGSARIAVWGGNQHCEKAALLATSEIIDSTDWRRVDFILHPEQDFAYLIIGSAFSHTDSMPYPGNVLIDDASPLVEWPASGLDTLFMPNLKPGSLPAWFQQMAGYIRFSGDNSALEKALYVTASGDTWLENPGVIGLVLALRQFPVASLRLGLVGSNGKTSAARKRVLEQALKAYHLEADTIEIRVFRGTAVPAGWVKVG